MDRGKLTSLMLAAAESILQFRESEGIELERGGDYSFELSKDRLELTTKEFEHPLPHKIFADGRDSKIVDLPEVKTLLEPLRQVAAKIEWWKHKRTDEAIITIAGQGVLYEHLRTGKPLPECADEFADRLHAAAYGPWETTFLSGIVGITLGDDGPIHLAPNIELRPTTDSELRSFLPPPGFHRQTERREPIPMCVLEERVTEARPRTAHPGPATDRLLTSLALMGAWGAGCNRIVATKSYWTGTSTKIGGPTLRVDGTPGFGINTLDHREELQRIYRWVDAVERQNIAPLPVALRRFRYARERVRAEDKLIDTVIGMEALLLAGEKEALRKTFATRGSSLLGPEDEPRERTMKSLRSIYDLRSALVHGGITELSEVDLHDTLPRAEGYLHSLLMSCLPIAVSSGSKKAYAAEMRKRDGPRSVWRRILNVFSSQ